MQGFESKVKRLKEIVSGYAGGDLIVAFSGGTDSSLILKTACEAAEKTNHTVYGIYLHTLLHPAGEIDAAAKTADEIGAVFKVLEIDELKEAGIECNPEDRCYRCKKYLFQRILQEAEKLHVDVVMEGTNRDDLQVYRPGIRAVRELGIVSPLAEAGLTKEEVRRLAAECGLSVSHKPASPCLATRFPYGTRLSGDMLRKAEQGEKVLKEFGFYNVRLRIYSEIVRIEVDCESFPLLLERRGEIISCLKELGYKYVTLDLEGFRSGSMDICIKKD